MSTSIRSKNKEQDFSDLEKAAALMLQRQLDDENFPDLYEQFSRNEVGSGKYYLEPYKSSFGSMIEQQTFIPFPREILEQYNRIECASFMGILPELHRVWVTVDNVLYLWNYQNPEEYDVYDGVSEVIVSVTLTTPKAGIFLDNVKYLLVLATPVEIVILAICADEQCKDVKIVPTTYTLPSDNVTMLKMVGSQAGRIFMVGNDGNIYELEYTNSESTWSSVLGSGPQRKCRKINHFAWNWQLTNLIPSFFSSFAQSNDEFVDLVVDNTKNILYGITKRGALSAFFLGIDGSDTNHFLKSFDLFEHTQAFLGYREIGGLRADLFHKPSSAGFQVVGIFPIPLTESKKVHLVVVLANGIRIYLSLLGEQIGYYTSASDVPGIKSVPQSMQVVYVRSPPHPNVISSWTSNTAANRETIGDLENDPKFVPSQQLTISHAYYSQGVFLLTMDKAQQQPDELLCIFEDVLARNTMATSGSGNNPSEASACMKEGIDIKTTGFGKVFDIKEVNIQHVDVTYANMKSLFHQSKTAQPLQEQSHHRVAAGSSSLTPLTFTNTLPMSTSRANKFGLDKADIDNLAVLGELCYQQMPISNILTQRQLLVLTNTGVHLLKKNRPVDVLYRILSHIDERANENMMKFFRHYGALQSSMMCVGVAVGLPRELGNATIIDPLANLTATSSMPTENIQYRAVSVIQGLTSGPSCRSIVSTSTNADSRLVANDNVKEFITSTFHDALYGFLGRVLRPIWHRAVVDVSTDKLGRVWSFEAISELRKPLLVLKNLLVGYYPTAIRNEQKSVAKRFPDASVVDSVTAQIAAQANRVNVNSEKALSLEAKAVEEASIRNLYMLISRSLHALALIEIWLTCEREWRVSVSLSKLKNFTFRSVVILPKVHDEVKKILHEVIQQMMKAQKVELADRLIDWLTKDAYHYFSAGDRFAFEASKRADEFLREKTKNPTLLMNHGSLSSYVEDCIQLYHRAATYWNSQEYVQGEHSELVHACANLQTLGSLGREAMVDICLKAARNFADRNASSSSSSSSSSSNMDLDLVVSSSSSPWDVGLYHGGSAVLSERDRQYCVMACHECLVHQIMWCNDRQMQVGMGASPMEVEKNTIALIQYAVRSSDDVKFHELLYSRLYAERQDLLLQITSKYMENFLQQKDAEFLYTYYMTAAEGRQENFVKAANLMYTLATTEEDMQINKRIEFFNKAITSARTAADHYAYHGGHALVKAGSSRDVLLAEEKELEDALEVAQHQLIIGEKLEMDYQQYQVNNSSQHRVSYTESQKQQLRTMEDWVRKLKVKLVDVTEMFNGVCMEYSQWDMCLRLLHICHIADEELIARLWKSFIYRLVPTHFQTDRAADILRRKREHGDIIHDSRGAAIETKDYLFEHFDAWLPNLKTKIVQVARELHVEQGSVQCPLLLIIYELEDILGSVRTCCQEDLDRDWIIHFVEDLHIPLLQLIETYFLLFDTSLKHRESEKEVQSLATIMRLLRKLVEKAERASESGSSKDDLDAKSCLSAIVSGQMKQWLERVRRDITALDNRRFSDNRWVDLCQQLNQEEISISRDAKTIASKRFPY